MSKLVVYIATSLDGLIAGEGDDLSWLPAPPDNGDDFGFADFLGGVGALLMGRRTFDVVAGFPGPWPFGDRPCLVATHRPLPAVSAPVQAISGDIGAMVATAKAAAGGRDVYIDGGALIRQALAADLVDAMTLTSVPVVLGAGVPLFSGGGPRRAWRPVGDEALPGGLLKRRFVRA